MSYCFSRVKGRCTTVHARNLSRRRVILLQYIIIILLFIGIRRENRNHNSIIFSTVAGFYQNTRKIHFPLPPVKRHLRSSPRPTRLHRVKYTIL